MTGAAVEDRFWMKVDRNGPLHPRIGTRCWLWTAAKCKKGYGRFSVGGKLTSSHQYSYELHHGPLAAAIDIDHRCHNTSCVNPDHLRAATRKQNMENLSGPHRDSRSKVRGVWRHQGRWRGAVMHGGKRFYVGVFDMIEAAESAVTAKRNELFTCNDVDRVA